MPHSLTEQCTGHGPASHLYRLTAMMTVFSEKAKKSKLVVAGHTVVFSPKRLFCAASYTLLVLQLTALSLQYLITSVMHLGNFSSHICSVLLTSFVRPFVPVTDLTVTSGWVQPRPPNWALLMTRAWLCRVPTPHEREQSLSVVHAPSLQSMGHSAFLHSLCFVVLTVSHLPPYAAGVLMPRKRDLVPPPQDLEQALQAPHAPKTQSIAHGWVLQTRPSSFASSTPPNSAAVVVCRWKKIYWMQTNVVSQLRKKH